MKARLHDIVNNKSKNIEAIISGNYASSYLNNTKWYKLMDELTTEFEDLYIKYKLVYDHVVEGYLFNMVDSEPYFLEPIKYKEVEWIVIPNEYEYWKNSNNLKAGKTIFKQDLQAINIEIAKIGKFEMEQFSEETKI